MMIPDSFLRFYKDGFGMQAYSPHFKRIFYYLSEKQDLLDWVVEPFDEKSKISDHSCRVPAPKGTHFIYDSLRYKTESVLDDYPETVVVSVKDFLTDKATLILPLMYQATEQSMAALKLPEHRILRFVMTSTSE